MTVHAELADAHKRIEQIQSDIQGKLRLTALAAHEEARRDTHEVMEAALREAAKLLLEERNEAERRYAILKKQNMSIP